MNNSREYLHQVSLEPLVLSNHDANYSRTLLRATIASLALPDNFVLDNVETIESTITSLDKWHSRNRVRTATSFGSYIEKGDPEAFTYKGEKDWESEDKYLTIYVRAQVQDNLRNIAEGKIKELEDAMNKEIEKGDPEGEVRFIQKDLLNAEEENRELYAMSTEFRRKVNDLLRSSHLSRSPEAVSLAAAGIKYRSGLQSPEERHITNYYMAFNHTLNDAQAIEIMEDEDYGFDIVNARVMACRGASDDHLALLADLASEKFLDPELVVIQQEYALQQFESMLGLIKWRAKGSKMEEVDLARWMDALERGKAAVAMKQKALIKPACN